MTRDQLLRDCLSRVLTRGVVLAREYLRSSQGSETLQRDMRAVIDSIESGVALGRVNVPYYWALYVHDGRPAVLARPGQYLCFFPNKSDDPRTSGGTDYAPTPGIRDSSEGGFHLTRKQFFGFLEQNEQRRANGQDPIMIVTKRVGPVLRQRKFFDVGLATLRNDVARIVPDRFRLFLQDQGLVGPPPKALVLRATIGRA